MLSIFVIAGNIRVLCRIRPIAIGENFGRFRPVVALDSSNVLLRLTDSKNKTYSFDNVFRPGSSQGAWVQENFLVVNLATADCCNSNPKITYTDGYEYMIDNLITEIFRWSLFRSWASHQIRTWRLQCMHICIWTDRHRENLHHGEESSQKYFGICRHTIQITIHAKNLAKQVKSWQGQLRKPCHPNDIKPLQIQ